ncbi:MAG TPA: STAS/SEC14 domain-containing protein [Chitinophagaceae bacterium]|nr:STAS/SEC14 domain-containing protein [Chitinophagaceae bacterium]
MIEIINDLPPSVIGFRATGKVTKEDYDKVLIPAVDAQSKMFKKLNFLLLLDTNASNYTFGAWVDDALVGLKHLTHWHKVAIVSHSDTIKKITNIFGHLVPGEYKGFKTEELEAARTWVAEP